MKEQLELVAMRNIKPGCNFSHLPLADTWQVNLRITESERFPFVFCDKCARVNCYRRRHQEPVN